MAARSLRLVIILVSDGKILLRESAAGRLECVEGTCAEGERNVHAVARIVQAACGAECEDAEILAEFFGSDKEHFFLIRARYVFPPGVNPEADAEALARRYLRGDLRWDWYPPEEIERTAYPDAVKKAVKKSMIIDIAAAS